VSAARLYREQAERAEERLRNAEETIAALRARLARCVFHCLDCEELTWPATVDRCVKCAVAARREGRGGK
jgi:hypothetical protein